MTAPVVKWYYDVLGGHTHVRVFVNGAKSGDLCFRNDEFEWLKANVAAQLIFIFIDETPPPIE
jgi:hypothetical protein